MDRQSPLATLLSPGAGTTNLLTAPSLPQDFSYPCHLFRLSPSCFATFPQFLSLRAVFPSPHLPFHVPARHGFLRHFCTDSQRASSVCPSPLYDNTCMMGTLARSVFRSATAGLPFYCVFILYENLPKAPSPPAESFFLRLGSTNDEDSPLPFPCSFSPHVTLSPLSHDGWPPLESYPRTFPFSPDPGLTFPLAP